MTPAATRTCPTCGRDYIDGRCPACELRFRFVHRELVLLLVLIAGTAVAFVLTRTAAASNHRMRLADAEELHAAGERDLRAGHVESALTLLRRATAKDPESRTYRLALANAYQAGQQYDRAEQVLTSVRDSTPEDPDVNLQLARLEAQRQDVTQAAHYYENTLAALWNGDPGGRQHQVRLELIHFLTAHGQQSRALSEILAMSAEMPDNPAAHLEAAQLFLDADEPRRAIDQFARVLAADPRNAAALAGTGEAAFALGDYPRARRYLAMAPADNPRVRDLREVTALVFERDPLVARLTTGDRIARLQDAIAQADRRLDTCITSGDADRNAARPSLEQTRSALNLFAVSLRSNQAIDTRDAIEEGLALVLRAEEAADKACGPGSNLDRALVLIARLHRVGEQ